MAFWRAAGESDITSEVHTTAATQITSEAHTNRYVAARLADGLRDDLRDNWLPNLGAREIVSCLSSAFFS
jgi:hypothetical protein